MSSDNSSSARSGGIGFMGLLFLLFLGLKLGEVGVVADWSWWAVTAPLWGPLVFLIAACIVFFTGVVLGVIVKEIFKAVRKNKAAKAREKARDAGVRAHQAETARALKADYDLRNGKTGR